MMVLATTENRQTIIEEWRQRVRWDRIVWRRSETPVVAGPGSSTRVSDPDTVNVCGLD